MSIDDGWDLLPICPQPLRWYRDAILHTGSRLGFIWERFPEAVEQGAEIRYRAAFQACSSSTKRNVAFACSEVRMSLRWCAFTDHRKAPIQQSNTIRCPSAACSGEQWPIRLDDKWRKYSVRAMETWRRRCASRIHEDKPILQGSKWLARAQSYFSTHIKLFPSDFVFMKSTITWSPDPQLQQVRPLMFRKATAASLYSWEGN